MVSYDYSTFPQGPTQRRNFVLSLLNQSELRETSYIEVKSEFDLMNRKDQIKVAKFILGAANRDLESASRHLGGYAILVAGLGKAEVIGVQGTEVIDLNKEVEKFIGVPGDAPEWFIEKVEFDDEKTVILVCVAPPTGSIYPSLATTDKTLVSGTVYIRNPGQTTGISGPQLRAKVRKLEAGGSPDLKINLTKLGILTEFKPRYSSARELITRRLAKLREDAPAVAKEADNPNDFMSMLNLSMAEAVVGKDYYGRTPKEFHERLRAAANYSDSELTDLATLIGMKTTLPVTVELELASTMHAEDIELTIRFPEDVIIIDQVTEDDVSELVDNLVPTPWKPSYMHGYNLSEVTRNNLLTKGLLHAQGPTSIKKIEKHKLVMHLKEVRFGEPRSFTFDEYRLITTSKPQDPVTAEWTLTARNYAGQITGTIELS